MSSENEAATIQSGGGLNAGEPAGGMRKSRVGRVVSDKMEKTVVVSIQTTHKHRLYKKLMRRTKNFMAHDERGLAKLGDMVRIVESRPMSKMKHWRVVEVLERKEMGAPVSEVAEVRG